VVSRGGEKTRKRSGGGDRGRRRGAGFFATGWQTGVKGEQEWGGARGKNWEGVGGKATGYGGELLKVFKKGKGGAKRKPHSQKDHTQKRRKNKNPRHISQGRTLKKTSKKGQGKKGVCN